MSYNVSKAFSVSVYADYSAGLSTKEYQKCDVYLNVIYTGRFHKGKS